MSPHRLRPLLALAVLLAHLPRLAAAPPPAADPFSGKVLETMNSSGYTYVLVKHGTNRTWVASRGFEVKAGEEVQVPGGWMMKDFQSTPLNRTFEWILFAPRVAVAGRPEPDQPAGPYAATAQLPPGHPQLPETPAHHPPIPTTAVEVAPGSIPPLPGGETVAQCHHDQRKLAGRKVHLRAVVVKASDHILGRNWLHLRDGTGEPGSDDLVVTTKQEAAPGDLVTVRGKLTRDRDFGSGYRFSILVEDAEVKIEKAAPAAGTSAGNRYE